MYVYAANLSKYSTLIEPVPYRTSTYSSIHMYVYMHIYIHAAYTLMNEWTNRLQEQKASGNNQDDQTDGEDNDLTSESTAEINMRLARIEFLMDKRPLLLNSVVLRQNPHNVHEWHKRAKLFKENSV